MRDRFLFWRCVSTFGLGWVKSRRELTKKQNIPGNKHSPPGSVSQRLQVRRDWFLPLILRGLAYDCVRARLPFDDFPGSHMLEVFGFEGAQYQQAPLLFDDGELQEI